MRHGPGRISWLFALALVLGSVAVLSDPDPAGSPLGAADPASDATPDGGSSAGGDRPGAGTPVAAFVAAPVVAVHDAVDRIGLDRAVRRSDGDVELTGWAVGVTDVEVLADGEVVATIPVAQQRPDIVAALGLDGDLVGFSGSVTVPRSTRLVCVVVPGRLPGPASCDRPTLDLPAQRIVALYGIPDSPALGVLGEGSARDALRRLLDQARPYEQADRRVVPAFEVIATVAQAAPGADGDYSAPVPLDGIRRYLDVIRRVDGIMILDLQPGRAGYLDQLPALEDLLAQPDVHLALDPEWDMGPGEVPAQVVGTTSAADIAEVTDWLHALIVEHRLPPKLLIVQQFQPDMITGRDRLDPPDTIELLLQMDGHAPPAAKIGNYGRLLASPPLWNGFKLFYQRDVPLMSPAQVLALDPPPDYVSYQ